MAHPQQHKTETLILSANSGDFRASLMTPSDGSGKLAVVLPGAGYSCKQPLLYFAIKVLLKKRFSVLAVETLYGDSPHWTSLATMESALKVVEDDSVRLFDEISKRFPTGIDTVLGRSLGTYTMACALDRGALSATRQLVWQTPSLNDRWKSIRASDIRSLGIIGTADERYEIAKPHLPPESLIVEGADHGMEIPGEPVRSIEILKRVTLATEDWLLG